MDGQQRVREVVESASVVLAILVNEQTADFELVDLSRIPLPVEVEKRYAARGLQFAGAIGLGHALGGFRVALEVEIAPALRDAICQEFLRLYSEALGQVERSLVGDGVPWLERLHGLPDPRDMN